MDSTSSSGGFLPEGVQPGELSLEFPSTACSGNFLFFWFDWELDRLEDDTTGLQPYLGRHEDLVFYSGLMV